MEGIQAMSIDKVVIKLYPADASKYKSNPPAYSGPATVGTDTEWRASAWKQEDKSGKSHLSVSVQKKIEKKEYVKNDAPTSDLDLDDSIPF